MVAKIKLTLILNQNLMTYNKYGEAALEAVKHLNKVNSLSPEEYWSLFVSIKC